MKTCLIVDDSRVIRLVARKMLERLDFATAEAAGGREALRVCESEMPDAVLVERALPELDGLGFLRELRALPDGDRPVVVVCAEGLDEGLEQEARESGADAALNKPFNADALRAAFAEAGAL